MAVPVGAGISVGFFAVDDLKAEAAELAKRGDIGPGQDQYANLVDWLDDFGLDLIQGAMRRFHEHMEGRAKTAVKKGGKK